MHTATGEELSETLDPEAVAASPAVTTSAVATNGKAELPDVIVRGVSVPQRPPPPGPEGERAVRAVVLPSQ